MYRLLESVLLRQPLDEEPMPAAPPQDPNQQQQAAAPSNLGPGSPPPDFTGGGEELQQPPMDPNAGAPPQQPDPSMQQQPPMDPNAAGMGGGDPNQDPNAQGDPNQDPNAQGDPNAMGMEEPSAESPEGQIDQDEATIFSDLKPEQMMLKNTELKQRYQELYKAVSDTLTKINKVSRTSYDDTMIDFIVKKLTNLRTMISDSLVNAYTARTYLENSTELKRFIYGFNYITKLVTQIHQSRIKRQQAIAKMNGNIDHSKDPEEFPIFNRGYDVQ